MGSFAFSRRSLFIGAAGLGVAACSKKKGIDIGVQRTQLGEGLSLLVPSFLLRSGIDQRVALLLNDNGFIAPSSEVRVAFAPNGNNGPGEFGPSQPAETHADAGTAPAYVTALHRFDGAGVFWVRAEYAGRTATAALQIDDPTTLKVPGVGAAMVRVATPTPADHRGVEPICTRSPSCELHSPSLDAALGGGKPLAVLFSTPKLCQTQVCGPVLDTLLAVHGDYADKVQFLHVEIYRDGSGNAQNPPTSPAVEAYSLPGEPVLFLARADGTIAQRIDGLFGRGEAIAALNRLAGR